MELVTGMFKNLTNLIIILQIVRQKNTQEIQQNIYTEVPLEKDSNENVLPNWFLFCQSARVTCDLQVGDRNIKIKSSISVRQGFHGKIFHPCFVMETSFDWKKDLPQVHIICLYYKTGIVSFSTISNTLLFCEVFIIKKL